MNAYVNDVLNNTEKVELVKNGKYYATKNNVQNELMAKNANMKDIENLSDIEKVIFEYLEKQDIEILVSIPKYTTCLVNYPHYKAIALEQYLLQSENAIERVISLSHELGHYLDVKFNHMNDAERFNLVYNDSNDNMITMELVAWIYGYKVLKALGFTEMKKFRELILECLSSYTRSMEKTVAIIKNSNEIVAEYEKECKKVMELIVS